MPLPKKRSYLLSSKLPRLIRWFLFCSWVLGAELIRGWVFGAEIDSVGFVFGFALGFLGLRLIPVFVLGFVLGVLGLGVGL